MTEAVRYDVSMLSDEDIYLFNEGSHFRLYYKLGAHPVTLDGVSGTYFAVWAPDAEKIFVIGDFNDWDKTTHPLVPRGQSGIWDGFIPGVGPGTHYKFHLHSRFQMYKVDKADVFGFFHEGPAPHGLHRLGPELQLERPGVDGETSLQQCLERPHVHLRGAPGLLAASPRRATAT